MCKTRPGPSETRVKKKDKKQNKTKKKHPPWCQAGDILTVFSMAALWAELIKHGESWREHVDLFKLT